MSTLDQLFILVGEFQEKMDGDLTTDDDTSTEDTCLLKAKLEVKKNLLREGEIGRDNDPPEAALLLSAGINS